MDLTSAITEVECTQNNGTVKTNITEIEVRKADGTVVTVWEAIKKLYSGTANEGGFVAYGCGFDNYAQYAKAESVALTIGSALKASVSTSVGLACGSVISNAIDVTNYKKVIFTHSSTSGEAGNYNTVDFGIITTKKTGQVTPVKSQALLSNTKSASGTVTVDISGLSGNVYFVFYVKCNYKTTPVVTNISNMYLQP